MTGATPGLGRRGERRRLSARAADSPDDPKTFVRLTRRAESPEFEIDADDARRRLRRGVISLAVLMAIVIGLLLAIPGLHGVARTVTHMHAGWLAIAVVLELLSCHAYVLAFLQVFDRAPIQFGALGARVALTEQAVGATISLGGAGSLAIGAWLLHERGVPPARIAERSAHPVPVDQRDQRDHAHARRHRPVHRGPAGTARGPVEHRPCRNRSGCVRAVPGAPALYRPARRRAGPGARSQRVGRDLDEHPHDREDPVLVRLAHDRGDRLPVVRHRRADRMLRGDRTGTAAGLHRACLSDRLHGEHRADPRQRWRARRQLRRHARPLRDQRHGRNCRDPGLPRDPSSRGSASCSLPC
jgi:hypothetical protein